MNKDDRKFFSSHCCYGIDNQNQTQAKIEMKSAHQQINPNHAQIHLQHAKHKQTHIFCQLYQATQNKNYLKSTKQARRNTTIY